MTHWYRTIIQTYTPCAPTCTTTTQLLRPLVWSMLLLNATCLAMQPGTELAIGSSTPQGDQRSPSPRPNTSPTRSLVPLQHAGLVDQPGISTFTPPTLPAPELQKKLDLELLTQADLRANRTALKTMLQEEFTPPSTMPYLTNNMFKISLATATGYITYRGFLLAKIGANQLSHKYNAWMYPDAHKFYIPGLESLAAKAVGTIAGPAAIAAGTGVFLFWLKRTTAAEYREREARLEERFERHVEDNNRKLEERFNKKVAEFDAHIAKVDAGLDQLAQASEQQTNTITDIKKLITETKKMTTETRDSVQKVVIPKLDSIQHGVYEIANQPVPATMTLEELMAGKQPPSEQPTKKKERSFFGALFGKKK